MTVKDAVLNKNRNTGHSNDFGIVECYTSEDAEYLLRVVGIADFRLGGYPVTGTMSKLTRASFYQLYGNIEASESRQEQHYQQQQYMQAYYKQLFDHLAKSGYYYDAASNEYRRLEDKQSFQQVEVDPANAHQKTDAAPLFEVAIDKTAEPGQLESKELPTAEENNAANLMLENAVLCGSAEDGQPGEGVQGVRQDGTEQAGALADQDHKESVSKPEAIEYCFTCMRQFGGEAHLAFHRRYSNLHKKAMQARIDCDAN